MVSGGVLMVSGGVAMVSGGVAMVSGVISMCTCVCRSYRYAFICFYEKEAAEEALEHLHESVWNGYFLKSEKPRKKLVVLPQRKSSFATPTSSYTSRGTADVTPRIAPSSSVASASAASAAAAATTTSTTSDYYSSSFLKSSNTRTFNYSTPPTSPASFSGRSFSHLPYSSTTKTSNYNSQRPPAPPKTGHASWRATASGPLLRNAPNFYPSKKLCYNWQSNGSCRFGDHCFFKHVFATTSDEATTTGAS
jgi:hypothetical protein